MALSILATDWLRHWAAGLSQNDVDLGYVVSRLREQRSNVNKNNITGIVKALLLNAQ